MNYLVQTLDVRDDSFSYAEIGKPVRYVVKSSGELLENGQHLGWYKLRNNQWHLYINDQLVESGPENGLFGLPEFELASLTRLINH